MPSFVQFVEILLQGVSVENVYDFVEIFFFQKIFLIGACCRKMKQKKYYSGKMIIDICVFTVRSMHFKNHNYSAFVISLAEESVTHSPIKAMGSLKD